MTSVTGKFSGQQSADDAILCGESPQSQSASASYSSEQFIGIPVRIDPVKVSDEEVNGAAVKAG